MAAAAAEATAIKRRRLLIPVPSGAQPWALPLLLGVLNFSSVIGRVDGPTWPCIWPILASLTRAPPVSETDKYTSIYILVLLMFIISILQTCLLGGSIPNLMKLDGLGR